MMPDFIVDENLNIIGDPNKGYCITGKNFNKIIVYICDSNEDILYSITKYSSMAQIYTCINNISEIELYSGHNESSYIKIYKPIKILKARLEEYVLAIYSTISSTLSAGYIYGCAKKARPFAS